MDWAQRWFDDFEVGDVHETPSHLMTEGDIIGFASEFDPQRFHVDPVAAKDSIYGGLIASGWHSGAVLMKLMTTALGPSSLGSPGCDQLRWPAPVRPGDEVRLQITVLEKRASASKPDRGVMRWASELLTQDDVVVMSLDSTMFMLKAPA
jgi:acyl dehydratase